MKPPDVLHDETFTHVKVTTGLPDADGIPTRTTVETDWDGYNIQQESTKETGEGQATTTNRYRVSGPLGPAIDSGDIIRWRGRTYAVDGDPDERRGKYRIEHIKFMMVRAEG